jgi:hypothetical protein
MLKINKGEPWLMWPDSMVSSFIDFPANRILDYDGNFELKMLFELEEEVTTKSSIITKLPTYMGFDIEAWGGMFILTDEHGEMTYLQFNYKWEPKVHYEFQIKKTDNVIELTINGEVLISYEMNCKLGSDNNSHIIFGCGNYPKNNFNLNYVGYNLYNLTIIKENEIICEHDFKKFIHDKAYDISDNCNFIHKY